MTNKEFQEQYLTYEQMFKTYAWKLTATSTLEPEDLLQQSILMALRGLKSYKEENNFKAWFHTVIRNTFITDYRKRAKAPQSLPLLNFGHPTYEIDPFELEYPQIIFDEFLTKREQLIVTLRHEGFMFREIAEQLNMSLGTTRSTMHRLKERLLKNNVRAKLYKT